MSEGRARFVLSLLMLLGPVLLCASVLLSDRALEPAFPRSGGVDLVVITFGSVDDPREWPKGDASARFARRGQRIGPLLATSDHMPAAAASLWTGRFPLAHGLRDGDDRLPLSTWTLASAASRDGTRTAAFLAEPLVRESGLPGFDQVVEDETMDAATLVRLARGFLTRETDRPALLWLHLGHPGPGWRDAESLLSEVEAALEESGRAPSSLVLWTAFGNRLDRADEARLLVPFSARLPAALFAGRSAEAALGHVDIPALLARLMRLTPPSRLAGQGDLQGRAETLWAAIRGSSGQDWNWTEGSFGEVLVERDMVARLSPDGRFQAFATRGPRGSDLPLQGASLEQARRRFDERRSQIAR